jgi:hypothetical protein
MNAAPDEMSVHRAQPAVLNEQVDLAAQGTAQRAAQEAAGKPSRGHHAAGEYVVPRPSMTRLGPTCRVRSTCAGSARWGVEPGAREEQGAERGARPAFPHQIDRRAELGDRARGDLIPLVRGNLNAIHDGDDLRKRSIRHDGGY